MATPAGITEGYEFVTVSRCGRGRIRVSFFVVIIWEVVESLYGVAGFGVEGNAVISGAVQVFQGMKCRFVVLMRWSMTVESKK